MENIFDRLQFVRGLNPLREDGIFENREDAVNYVIEKQVVDRPTVVGEPMVLRYDSGSATKGPHVILAIGSLGVGTPTPANRTFFIDIQKTEEEIAELDEKLEAAIKSLTLIPLESETLKLQSEKTDDGTILSGDVKIADYRIVSGRVNENIIQTEGDKGLYAFVDMDYDPETFVITFNVNGVTKEFQLPVDQHVVRGWYDPREESIFLKLADDSQVKILVTKLIEEWTVLPDGQTINDYDVSGTTVNFTPIVFAKTHVGSKATEHEGIYEWQDVLEADVRVADHITDNIIHKDKTGRYLYVKGTADNILYKDGQTVKDALDNVDCKVSTSAGNLIYKRPDGIFAAAMLDYDAATNKIKYKYSDGNVGEIKEVEFQLNSVKVLEDITYDPINETIVIRYIDAQGEYQKVVIPVKDIIEEWDVNNEAHNIFLNKYRSQGQGKDILSADAKIHEGDNNILEDKNHELYVNGVSKNIKYDVTGDTTVKDVLDGLSASTEALDAKIGQEIADRTADIERIDNTIGSGFTADPHENITYKFESLSAKVDSEIERSITKDEELETALNAEITRSTEKDEEHDEAIERIDTTIGSGFSTDAHETVTYKFEQLQNQVNEEAEKLQNEIDRSISADTVHDGRIDAIEEEIGDGFGPRNTVRDEIDNLQAEIEAVSADSASSLKDIINIDESINVDKTEPTKPVISVNLSAEVEDERYNIIKLNADGLFANVDLSYEQTANKLIFHTSNGQPDKEIQLDSMSSIISIEYIPSLEVIRITYLANGHDVKTTDVPVGDLINEWRVEDGHPHAVQLEKVRIASGTSEQDILKASVIITDDHDDNILVMDDGALYVPGAQITQNAQNIAALKDRMDSAESDIDALEDGLADEIDRATSEEQRIESKLNIEITRSTEKDAELETVLNNEIARSTAKDQELTDAINNEVIRATSAETALSTTLTNEINRSTQKDVEHDTLLSGLRTDLDNEISRATNEEEEIKHALSAEATVRISADTALQTAIENEIARATSAETTLTHLIEDEAERRESGDSQLNTKIETETTRAREAETRIETALNNEIARAQAKEGELNTAIVNETLRAQEADNELYQKIADEKSAREVYDATLDSKIDAEKSRAQVTENTLSGTIITEILNRENADSILTSAVTTETTERQAADEELRNLIDSATLTFDDTNSVDFTKSEDNKVTADVKLANAPDNIILIDSVKEGLFASVDLDYEPATNKIKFKVNGAEKEFTIAAGSILEDAWYDSVSKNLVFKTRTAEGEYVEVTIPAYDLFDEWYPEQPVSGTALSLTLTTGRTDPTTHEPLPNILSGSVLVSPLEDNLLIMDTNGLYVPGGSVEVAECANKKADKLYNLLYGEGASMSSCGESSSYIRGTGCIISAATSFSEADQMLNDAFCQFIDDWEVYGFDTPSTHTDWLKIGQNRHMLVDVRLSHGLNAYESSGMTDDDLTISDFIGDYIEPTVSGFSDTNVLRIVDLKQGKTGEPLEADNKYNGVYLSNAWDCGLYYGTTEADIAAKAAAEAAGYVTDYYTDEDSSASNYNYMNNVRQSDI